MLKHIQARVKEDEFKIIKKTAVDLGLTVEEFIRTSVLDKVKKENLRKEGNTTVIFSEADMDN